MATTSDERRAWVRNAADETQVKRAGTKEQRVENRRRAVIAKQLSSYDGRAFCWEVLSLVDLEASPFSTQVGIQTYQIGKQDVLRSLKRDLVDANPILVQTMETEARERLKHENAETDATHTATAGTAKQGDTL